MPIELYNPSAKGAFHDTKIAPTRAGTLGNAKARTAENAASLAKDYADKLETAYVASESTERLAKMQAALTEWDSQQQPIKDGQYNTSYLKDWEEKYKELSDQVLDGVGNEKLGTVLKGALDKSYTGLYTQAFNKGIKWEHEGLKQKNRDALELFKESAINSPEQAEVFRAQAAQAFDGMIEGGLITESDAINGMKQFDSEVLKGTISGLARAGDIEGMNAAINSLQKDAGVLTNKEAAQQISYLKSSIRMAESMNAKESEDAFLATQESMEVGLSRNQLTLSDIDKAAPAFPRNKTYFSQLRIRLIKQQDAMAEDTFDDAAITVALSGDGFFDVTSKDAKKSINAYAERSESPIETSMMIAKRRGFMTDVLKGTLTSAVMGNEPKSLEQAALVYQDIKDGNPSSVNGMEKKSRAKMEQYVMLRRTLQPQAALDRIAEIDRLPEDARTRLKTEWGKLTKADIEDGDLQETLIEYFEDKQDAPSDMAMGAQLKHEYRILVKNHFLINGGDYELAKSQAINDFTDAYAYEAINNKVMPRPIGKKFGLTEKQVREVVDSYIPNVPLKERSAYSYDVNTYGINTEQEYVLTKDGLPVFDEEGFTVVIERDRIKQIAEKTAFDKLGETNIDAELRALD